jgi:single-stranded-DNA-specific exonuclease
MWSLPPPHAVDIALFAQQLGVHPIVAQVLVNRGLTDLNEARLFLEAPITALHDPFLLPDMELAVERIIRAIHTQEPITLFGDYDTDGVCGTAMVARFFRDIGISVSVVLPHRVRDGYGVTAAAVHRMVKAQGRGLLITIDNGTSAHDAVRVAQESGLDVIITDHHSCPEELPPALAIVNPHRLHSRAPYRDLCGTGVAFKLLIALRRRLRESGFFKHTQPNLQQALPFVAIATIADVMPLTGENRILVRRGLQMLAATPGPGLSALMRMAMVAPNTLDTEAVAFRIAPRLNAAGRMGDADIAFQCLFENDAVRAAQAAEVLERHNTERQAAEQAILRQLETPENQEQLRSKSGIAVGSPDYAVGVVGIIAGRLARHFDKPTVVVSFNHGVGKGSARGIMGVSVLEILKDCAGHLVAFGGHAQAAGITVTPEAWPEFCVAFDAAARRHGDGRLPTPTRVDASVDATELTIELGRDLKRLAPFGEGNPAPLLAVRPLAVHGRRRVGNNHLKMRIGNTMTTVDAIGFGLWNHPASQAELHHVIGIPELNTWNGETRLQLRLVDLNPQMG